MKKFILFAIVCLAFSACTIAALAPRESFGSAPLPTTVASNRLSAPAAIAPVASSTDSAETTHAFNLPDSFQTVVRGVVFRVALDAKRLELKFRHTLAVFDF